jgi:hypothetical protein
LRSRFSSRTPSLGAACLRIFPQNVHIFRSLWADPAVQVLLLSPQAAFARGPSYGLWESTGHFYSRLSSLVEFNQPSESDVLRARRRTVGIEDFWYEWTSEVGKLQVQLVELPFQLTLRKYGRHLNGNWVILCVALTSYKDVHSDVTGPVSVFADSVALCQSLLAENSVIVYLTKPDQLQTTLEYYPLEVLACPLISELFFRLRGCGLRGCVEFFAWQVQIWWQHTSRLLHPDCQWHRPSPS